MTRSSFLPAPFRSPGLLALLLGFLALSTADARPLEAQDRPGGWAVFWENDSFVAVGGSDRNYTNGVRLVWGGRSHARNTFRGGMEAWWGGWARVGRRPWTSSVWTVGQNFFTPSTITDYEVDPDDRPFAGIAYGGLRMDATERIAGARAVSDRARGFSFTRQHSLELNVGVLGAASGDRVFQTFAHILRENRVPKGWRHQLPHEPFVSANTMWRVRAGWHFLDVTPHAGLLLGMAQSYPYAGGTVRVGFNMSDFPALLGRNTAVPVAQRPDWELSLIAGAEGRVMGHNAFVEGGLRPDSEGVDAETFVGDFRFGLSVRLTDWRLSWTQVRRSPEMADGSVPYRRYHNYGSLTLGYEPGTRTAAAREGTLLGGFVDGFLGSIFDGLLLEVATGPADAEGAAGALGSRFGLSKRFWGDRVALGGEVVGMAREFGPPPLPGGDHEDLFLVGKLVTARWIPFQDMGPGRLHLRTGVGSALHKRQVTPGEPGPRPASDPCPTGTVLESDDLRHCNGRETGTAWMLGAGYWFRMPGDQASLGIDYAWTRLALDEPASSVDFATLTLGLQWHPR